MGQFNSTVEGALLACNIECALSSKAIGHPLTDHESIFLQKGNELLEKLILFAVDDSPITDDDSIMAAALGITRRVGDKSKQANYLNSVQAAFQEGAAPEEYIRAMRFFAMICGILCERAVETLF